MADFFPHSAPLLRRIQRRRHPSPELANLSKEFFRIVTFSLFQEFVFLFLDWNFGMVRVYDRIKTTRRGEEESCEEASERRCDGCDCVVGLFCGDGLVDAFAD
ncbi:hypothetical protein LOK49_LG06G02585 [Camellia lanceoleosa]|uniref:Uncharacterized protein n=1 Tax=Camellia lanceoleosa TaxID=1840588 RepID=A0ACC0HBZ3_9ERIC|nr:hypothetical protein LOK49_LG06G02585 [Camellia lanceoleosa]